MSITQDQINRFFEILAASKLPSELTELLQAPTSSQFIVIQTGSEDAKKINVSRVRGALGNYNASSNNPFLSNGAATEGDSYFVTNTGTVDFGNGNLYLPANSVVSYLNGQWRKGGISTYSEIVALLGFTPESTSNKGVADGYVGLDENVKINPIYLTGFIPEIIEGTYVDSTTFNDSGGTAVTPEAAKIYLDTVNPGSKVYRWGGTAFAEIAASPGSSDAVPEGVTNLYFKENRVRETILSGISFVAETAITAADSILTGFGKLQAQISDLSSSISNKLDRGGYTLTAQDLDTAIGTKANDTIVVKSITVNGVNSTPTNGLINLGTLGSGDMLKAVYDPNSKNADVFLMDNMVEGTTTKILTDAERLAISDNSAKISYTDAVQVDLNIAYRHTHPNKVTLNKFGEDGSGLPTYNGLSVDTTIAQRDVYDGLDSTDNTISLSANNGKVLKDVQDTQQTEINLKAPKESPTFTGTVTLPTGTLNRIPKYTSAGVLGDSVITELANGNVGIGTTNPTLQLHIVKANNTGFKVERAGVGDPASLNFKVTNGRVYLGYNSAWGMLFQDEGNSNYSGIVRFINGSSRWLLGNSTINDIGGSTVSVKNNAAIGANYWSIAAPENGMIVQGNVGIGITTPTEKLDVTGNIKLSGIHILGQYTTATRPAYVKGSQFFDTTINKMVIGGATAWEEVTSS